jgi:hypothetical protein
MSEKSYWNSDLHKLIHICECPAIVHIARVTTLLMFWLNITTIDCYLVAITALHTEL